jgi:hypothetical protein
MGVKGIHYPVHLAGWYCFADHQALPDRRCFEEQYLCSIGARLFLFVCQVPKEIGQDDRIKKGLLIFYCSTTIYFRSEFAISVLF